MCGFVGYLDNKHCYVQGDERQLLGHMADQIIHRGPDQEGYWWLPNGLGFAHRRLSIIDLSDSGRQPMQSASRRYCLVLNGEIYNYQALKKQLPGPWRGTSDTEVLLAAFERWGVAEALHKVVGMFAFALWDEKLQHLTLAVDRMGEKPLYYGIANGVLLFGSEVSALAVHPAFDKTIDPIALDELIRLGYIGTPRTIYKHIKKVPQGALFTVTVSNMQVQQSHYFQLKDSIAQRTSALADDTGRDAEYVTELDHRMRQAVTAQITASDVPVGALLSGGIDSSLIVALMQACSSQRVKTFTIGFHEASYNEAHHACAIAKHLGTDHTELYVSMQDALALVSELPYAYSEPFADVSQLPTLMVCRLARQTVKVALSGDAGDELFGGYHRHTSTPLFQRLIAQPKWLRSFVGKVLATGLVQRLAGFNYGKQHNHLNKLVALLQCDTVDSCYLNVLSAWHGNSLVQQLTEPSGVYWREYSASDLPLTHLAERMMYWDACTYLKDDILVKVDRAAMRYGLETRVPFLDHRLVEWVWREVPLQAKIRAGKGKFLLRALLQRYLPRHLFEREKSGFAVPIGHWLRHDLHDFASTYLDASLLKQQGYLAAECVQALWQQHRRNQYDRAHLLWHILMFQSWLGEYHAKLANKVYKPRRV